MRNRLLIAIMLIVMMFATTAFAQTSQTITLKSGFNFASFTTAISITPQQLLTLNSNIEDVYLYSAAAGSFLSVKDGTLTSLAAGKGYIVKNSSGTETSVTVSGTAISTIGSITLKSGFNLIGFSKVPTTAVTFSSLMASYSTIKGLYKWSPAAGAFLQVVRDASGTVTLLDGSDPTFKAGESYFFNVTADTTVNYDGTSIVVGASPVDPTAKAAEITGTINSAAGMAELGLNYQTSGEAFDVTLVDSDGNAVPSISLDAAETNPKVVNDGQSYSFKVKDFTKAYKVIAKAKVTANKMVSVFVGKVKADEKITNRDVTPISTAISMIYADPTKEASAFKADEELKKADANFQKRIAPYVSDLETKRQALLKDGVYDTPEKLERAYKDAVVGSLDPNEIAVIKEGLDAVIGKLEAQLTMLEKLKDALALIATSGQRQNETNVKSAQGQLSTIITATENVTAEQEVNTDAKISYGLVCSDLGDIFNNSVNNTTTASSARSLMAAYQIMSDETNTLAEAEYKKGYDMVKNITIPETDTTSGRDKSLAAAILKNASVLAKNDNAKLDEAKQKADVLISKFESEGTLEVVLPTGEVINKDKILEKKGDALINAGRPSEAVEVFEDITESKVKNFGLGRAFLGLNDIENAYKNLKDSVKTVVKSDKGAELRMNDEQKFPKVNEALFAFAAVVDKLKNAPATDTALTAVKNRLITLEQSATTDAEKILVDTNVTVGKIIKTIKPATNFFAVGKKLVIDNPTQQNFGQQFVDLTESTDSVKLAFNNAMKLLFNANKIIDAARVLTTLEEKQKLIYAGTTATGTVEAPAADTALKLLEGADTAFEAIFDNPAVVNQLKGDARYHMGLVLLSQYRALRQIDLENKELLGLAKEIFLEIREKIAEAHYAHLSFAIVEMIRTIEDIEKKTEGVIAEAGGLLEAADAIMKRAMSFYHGREYKIAIEQFQKAFDKFEEVYNSTDVKITVKMKEAALYYGAFCLHYKFRLLTVKDDIVKVKLLERLKLFRLKFPESNFVNSVRDILNELESGIALQNAGEVGVNSFIDSKPRPGAEFNKALSLIEKLRLYYKNNFSTMEIEMAFSSVEVALKAIVDDLSLDAKYVGNITSETDLKSLRAMAKFQRAIMYMERYVMHKFKDVNYKNIALKLFSELITEFPEQGFIEEAKRFVLQLQNEGQIVDQFVEGRPIFANIFYSPRVIDLASNMLREVNIAIDIKVPDTTAVNLLSEVKVELKRFGNPVYLDDAAQTAVTVTLTKNATNQNKWEGKLNLGANIAAGVYDAIVNATTTSGIKAEAIFPVVVKGATELARIKFVEILTGPSLKVVTDGTDSVVYVSVMQPNVVSSMFDNKLTPVADVPAHIKLEAVTGETGKFLLDITKNLSSLKAGNYIFLFKMISAASADLEASLNNPVHMLQFPFFIKQEIDLSLKATLEPVYRNILTNFNDLSKTGAERIAAYEKMFVLENFTMNAAKRLAWIKLMDSLDSLKVSVVDDPFVEYDPNVAGRVVVRVPWKIEGKYKIDMLNGLFLADGTVLLPPGKTGFALQNFFIKTDHYFVKTLDGTSWGLTLHDAAVINANEVVVAPTDKKPAITKIGGIAVPTDGTAAKLGEMTVNPFAVIEGTNLNALTGERRVIKVHNPKLMVPVFLCDNGSTDWTDTSIKFSTAPLKGVTGASKIELFDSKYGSILAIPVEFTASTIVFTPKVIVRELVSGTNISNPFGLIRPFEIDRTKDLVVKGDMLLPASGTFSLKYFKAAVDSTTTGSFVEIGKSGSTNWTNYEITIAAASLPAVADLPDYKATSLVIWDDTANAPASSQMLVLFRGAAAPAVTMAIDTVNTQSAANVVTLLPPSDGTTTMTPLVITGRNLKHPNKMRADFMFFIDNAVEVVPIAFNDAAGWGSDSISVMLDWAKLAGKTNLVAVLVIFDEMQRLEVTARVRVKFTSSVLPQPTFIRTIKGVNDATNEVKLYQDSWGATPPATELPTNVNIIYNTVPMVHMIGDSFGVYLTGAQIKFRTALKEYMFPVKQLDWMDTTVHAAVDAAVATELAGKIGILSIVDAAGAIISNRLFVKFVQSTTPLPVTFALVSPSFAANGTIPVEFSGIGANVSPELRWTGAPTGTVSYALVCEDPTDASNPYIHWVIYGMPGTFTGLAKAVPQGATPLVNNATLKQLATYNDKIGYDGPNPPTGEVHVYNFKLYALKAAPGPLVTGMTALRLFITNNVIGAPAVLNGVFAIDATTVPVTAKYLNLKTAPTSVPAAPSFQAGTPSTQTFDPALHQIKIYDQISGTTYPVNGDPTNAASYTGQIPIDGVPKIIIQEIIEKVSGNVLARNIVGKCPLISEIPANVTALELQNPPIDIKTTTASMLAFEKLGNNVPNLPVFDFANMTPLSDGVISKLMQSTDTTSFMTELNKAIGGTGVVDNIILARQGVKDAQAGVTQLRDAAAQIPETAPEPYITQRSNLLAAATLLEGCMAKVKNALNLVPASNIPNPAAATELLIAYVNVLKALPTLTQLGVSIPDGTIPPSITLPGANGATNTVNASTTAADISSFMRAIPSQVTEFQSK
ncbi:MAG: hypothetical protein A2008_10345 [Candidatus Wallbacteria bacterium GWC2_49_35]|uniref:Uncharacterized protein n=1 Tax=Candidatus Wallbacteria bacterium GWC2_49_35 TaxID=1817813 RepID=A0A1F7WVA1_9BACT|nr:MAG: hypothetical protein A2008_10345 [Candidatus Wallbacteria bacterium GWC2_49_35]